MSVKMLDYAEECIKNVEAFYQEKEKDLKWALAYYKDSMKEGKMYKQEDVSLLSSFLQHTPILILTATPIETGVLHKKIFNAGHKQKLIQIRTGNITFYFAAWGRYNVVSVCQPAMGAMTKNGTADTLRDIFKVYKPSMIVSVGICFGLDMQNQTIGDVQIAERIYPYDVNIKVEDGRNEVRGDNTYATDQGIMGFLRQKRSLTGSDHRHKHGEYRVAIGNFLTGGALVNDAAYLKRIKGSYHVKCVAGEMEGYGLYSEANKENFPCVMIKAICDWGAGKNSLSKDKTENDQRKDSIQAYAVYNACDVCEALLRDKQFVQLPPDKNEYDLFIAYHGTTAQNSSRDKAIELCGKLTKDGIKCFLHIMPENKEPFELTSIAAIQSKLFLLVASARLVVDSIGRIMSGKINEELCAFERAHSENGLERVYAYDGFTQEAAGRLHPCFAGAAHFVEEQNKAQTYQELYRWVRRYLDKVPENAELVSVAAVSGGTKNTFNEIKIQKYHEVLREERFLLWRTALLKKLYYAFDAAYVFHKEHPVITIAGAPGIAYPFKTMYDKNELDIREHDWDIKTSTCLEYKALVGHKIRNPKLLGYTLNQLKFNDKNQVVGFTSKMGTYEQNVYTSHILEYELYKAYNSCELNDLSTVDADTILKQLPLRSFIHNGKTDKKTQREVLTTGVNRASLLSVQAAILFYNEDDDEYVAIVNKRSNDVATKPGYYQFLPAGGFEMFAEAERHEAIVIRDNFSVRKGIFREYLEELFASNKGADDFVPAGVDYDIAQGQLDFIQLVMKNPNVVKVKNMIDRGTAHFEFLGIVVNMEDLRVELSFALRVDDKEYANNCFSYNHESIHISLKKVSTIESELEGGNVAPASAGLYRLLKESHLYREIVENNYKLIRAK